MNDKEIGELRRRIRPEKSSITHIVGCFINESHEIAARFDQPLATMDPEEEEKFLSILRKTLSGPLGKNLLNLSFETRQVVDSDEHRLLMTLRDSSLKDDPAVQTLFEKIASAVRMEGGYLILMVCDAYDVFHKHRDGAREEDSGELFRYFLCSICPVKATRPALSYYAAENEFRNSPSDWIVSPPAAGFLFPAFDDRSTNIYGALYYSRSVSDLQQELIDVLFKSPAPMPAEEQKETFQAALCETLGEECSYDVMQTVHSRLCEMVQEHKDAKEEEPLTITAQGVEALLENSGVSQPKAQAVREKLTEEFGEEADLCPGNLVDLRQFRLETPDVSIRVNPERRDLIETRIIDGTRYILIRADEGVEVNGVSIRINDD